jgi:hypothetical protein
MFAPYSRWSSSKAMEATGILSDEVLDTLVAQGGEESSASHVSLNALS